MGNMQCPAEDAALLASVARDICPFPNYNPSPHYINMLSINSSHHLKNHYAAVQTSLTPKQLEEFTHSLRSTFGREGKVTLGGVGVVALSLAILFDTLAEQVKGKFMPESGPIPNLFLKNPGGYYPPNVFAASNYLRLVPYIANNPERMREETKRYLKLVKTENKRVEEFKRDSAEDITGVNGAVVQLLQQHMENHLARLINSTSLDEIDPSITGLKEIQDSAVAQGNQTEPEEKKAHGGKSRKRRIPLPDKLITFNLNCDPEAASKVYLTEVLKSNDTQEAFQQCRRAASSSRSLIHYTASLVWLDFINSDIFDFRREKEILIAQREDFDLKANSLRIWKE